MTSIETRRACAVFVNASTRLNDGTQFGEGQLRE
jgi:gamma-glutamyl phosphate reductase